MPTVIAVPLLGRDMAGGVVAEWYRPDGAKVDTGEAVCRVECDFIAVEVEAETPGILRHRKPVGSIERPGTVLAVLLAPGEPLPPDEVFEAPVTETAEAAELEPASDYVDEPVEEDVAVAEPPMAPGEPIVVPFRRRSSDQPQPASWNGVPGDSAEFDTSLFDAPERAEPLPEPGADIPGLPLWEEEPPDIPAQHIRRAPVESHETRFARIAAEAQSAAQVLTVQVRADAREAARAVGVLAREWRTFGVTPLIEDLVMLATARALDERHLEPAPAGLVLGGWESDGSFAFSDVAGSTVRDLASIRESGGDEDFERAAWVLVSLSELGIDSVQPRLPAGMAVALGLGAVAGGTVTLTMSFDSAVLAETEAGRVLARIRQLIEEPYGLLA